MTEVFIGIGTNLGRRADTLIRATAELCEWVDVMCASRAYETDPVGLTNQPAFLNAVLKIQSDMGARALLDHLLAVEHRFGRIRAEKWGPRILDLDILLYGNEVIQEEGLQVPHPHLHLRAFVLGPLCDLVPEGRHPTLDLSFAELFKAIGSSQGMRVIEGLSLLPDTQ